MLVWGCHAGRCDATRRDATRRDLRSLSRPAGRRAIITVADRARGGRPIPCSPSGLREAGTQSVERVASTWISMTEPNCDRQLRDYGNVIDARWYSTLNGMDASLTASLAVHGSHGSWLVVFVFSQMYTDLRECEKHKFLPTF